MKAPPARMIAKEKVILRRVPDLLEVGYPDFIATDALSDWSSWPAIRWPMTPSAPRSCILSLQSFTTFAWPTSGVDLIYDGYLCLFFTWCRRLLKGRL
jgi:hypothetical protein